MAASPLWGQGGLNQGWGAASNAAKPKKKPAPVVPGSGRGQYTPDVGGYYNDPYFPGADDDYWNPGTTWPGIGAGPDPGLGNAPRPPTTGGDSQGKGSITINGRPDYQGILDRFTADWRARLNTGLANMNASKLSNARAAINRLGVRDPNEMMAALKSKNANAFGLTLEDLQAAADNPWSDLKAIGAKADRQRGQGEAVQAAKGGFRSGGTSRMYEMVEDERARTEALSREEALGGLGQRESEMAMWQQQQEDDLAQRTAQMGADLATQYQPQEARWDDNNGGYRAGNVVYDEYGNVIKRL